MKKNVIHIIVDAYCYNSLQRTVGKREVTPFLNSLSKKSLCFERMFSQAHYTEA
jgi:phosphoglycerol transferase MdoB-like AlkP superfamily enzyme